jgi:hypothetical protein
MAAGLFRIRVCTAKYTSPRAIHTAPIIFGGAVHLV